MLDDQVFPLTVIGFTLSIPASGWWYYILIFSCVLSVVLSSDWHAQTQNSSSTAPASAASAHASLPGRKQPSTTTEITSCKMDWVHMRCVRPRRECLMSSLSSYRNIMEEVEPLQWKMALLQVHTTDVTHSTLHIILQLSCHSLQCSLHGFRVCCPPRCKGHRVRNTALCYSCVS